MLITAVLALLLVGYVFGFGGSREDRNEAERQSAGSTARCYSRETSELLKQELFRRATALRGRDQAGMAQMANFSVVRVTSAVSESKGEADLCTASLVLDLPPDVTAVGGRNRFKGNVKYEVRTGPTGEGQLRLLSNVDRIVTPLATVGVGSVDPLAVPPADTNMTGLDPEAVPPEPAPNQTATVAPTPAPPPVPRVASPAARAAEAQRQRAQPEAASRQPPPRPAPPKQEVAEAAPPRRPAPTPPAEPPAKKAAPAPAAEPVRQAARARPSFDCRRARARSEVAVCSDAGLASLDRQMSGQFFNALRSARPGQRALLQRSRNRFLAYRNRCGSNSCIAQAYRERIREIDAIMTGGY